MRFSAVFILVLLLFGINAEEIDTSTCQKLCKVVNLQDSHRCRFPDYRYGVLNRAFTICSSKGISHTKCVDELAKNDVSHLKNAMRKSNSFKRKKIAIVDLEDITTLTTDVIDIPGWSSGVWEDDLPGEPDEACWCPEVERIPASATFGSSKYDEKFTIKGQMCPKQGCLLSDELRLPPAPLTSTFNFRLEHINPPQYSETRRNPSCYHRIPSACYYKYTTDSLTHSIAPTIDVYCADKEMRRLRHGNGCLMVQTSGGQAIAMKPESGHIYHHIGSTRERYGRVFKYVTHKQEPISLYKMDNNGDGIIRHGDIVCFTPGCRYCYKERVGRMLREKCADYPRYRIITQNLE
ncbi:hypothetical protein PCE1_003042 [Barthelona sp. PCE]